MRRLTIKGFKTAGFLLKAAASGIESLLEETYPVLREGGKTDRIKPKRLYSYRDLKQSI